METTPKVCIFTETFHPVVGGGETQARALAEGLEKYEVDVLVLTRRTHTSLQKIERYGKVNVYRLPPTGGQHLKKWGLLLSGFPALFTLRKQYDLVFVSGFRVIGVPAVLMSKMINKKCILKADNNGEMSGDFFEGGLAYIGLSSESKLYKAALSIRNRILNMADCFVAISSDIRDEYLSNGVWPESKINFIPNSVDVNTFHPVTEDEKLRIRDSLSVPNLDLLVTYTGRLVSYKGLPQLLRVWEDLVKKHSQIGLLLVGSGSLDIYNCEDELKEYVREKGLEKSVFFTGEVQNVQNYLQSSDIFVFPTEIEAFGISLVEAMSCGLPVISTNVGGIKDILDHGKNGLVVSPGDPQQLYAALNKLITDRALSATLGRAARQTVQDKYSLDSVNRDYMALFKDVYKQRHM